MPGPKTGHKMKLYRNTATNASPTWAEISQVGDVGIPELSMGLAELKRRANNFTKNLATLIQSIAVEFRLIHGLDAATFLVLRQAFFAGTSIEYLIADGTIATSGNQGLRCPCLISDFPWDQPLEDVAGYDVRLAVSYMEESSAEIDPAWLLTS